jgi:UDP-glucose 4-epimerase
MRNGIKYLITGGAGFIGSNLCDFLVRKGYSVSIIDDLSTGYLENLKNSINSIEFYNEKIEQFNFKNIVDFDAVIHLAAQPSVPLSVENFGDSSSANLLGTINIIEYCRANRVPLIYASSSAIYGNLTLGDDKDSTIDLLSPYAADKYAMEIYTKISYKLYQLSSIGLRFFNVYGPRQDPNSAYSGVISIFADRILKNQDIIINGGCQTRDFVYVNDVVNVIYRAIRVASEKTVCEVSNVLTGESITINYLADQMMDIVGEKVGKEYQDLPTGDPEQSDGTTQKMVSLFNVELENFIQLKGGLAETIKFIRN